MKLRDRFIEILAREGGEEAVYRFLTRQPYKSESQEEAAHNFAVKQIIESEEFWSLSAMERVAALLTWLRPVSQKSLHNARTLCQFFYEAEKAHRIALSRSAAEIMAVGYLGLLREEYLFKIYRAMTLDRQPSALLRMMAGPYAVRVWRLDADKWYAGIFVKSALNTVIFGHEGGAIFIAPHGLKVGHLSSQKIRIQAEYSVEEECEQVIVTVSHRDGVVCKNPNCRLPATIVFRKGPGGWSCTEWTFGMDEMDE
jgi:hypothetical protein